MTDFNVYDMIEVMPVDELYRLVIAHGDIQSIAEDIAPPSSKTLPVPTAPTVPTRRAA